jgi:transcriptional regulator with XRE-family HTH domain
MQSESNELVGQRLKFARTLLAFSQGDIAKEIGTTQANYSLIEAGKVALAEKHAKKVGDILEVNFEWLLHGGTKAVSTQHLFFRVLPSYRLRTLSPIYQSRRKNELMHLAGNIFASFVKENIRDDSYSIVEQSPEKVFLGSRLKHGCVMLLELDDPIILNEIVNAFDGLGLNRVTKNIDVEVLERLSSKKSQLVVSLMKTFGFYSLSDAISEEFNRDVYKDLFVNGSQERAHEFRRIVGDIMKWDISLSMIRAELAQRGREDLLENHSNNSESDGFEV